MTLEKLKYTIGYGSEARPLIRNHRLPMTLVQALDHVRAMRLPEDVEAELIARLSRYPANTMDQAIRKIDKIIENIQLDLRMKKVSQSSEELGEDS